MKKLETAIRIKTENRNVPSNIYLGRKIHLLHH